MESKDIVSGVRTDFKFETGPVDLRVQLNRKFLEKANAAQIATWIEQEEARRLRELERKDARIQRWIGLITTITIAAGSGVSAVALILLDKSAAASFSLLTLTGTSLGALAMLASGSKYGPKEFAALSHKDGKTSEDKE